MKKVLVFVALTGLTVLSGCSGSSVGSGGGPHPKPATLQSVTISPSNPTINMTAPPAAAATQQFTATGHYSDGSSKDLTSSVTWTSSAPAVATVNSSGLATSVGVGSTTIMAASGSVNSTSSLGVTAPLVSITVSPNSQSIPLGKTQQFTATGHYSDGSSSDITSQVTWSSSAPGVASINTSGLASSASMGSTNISASQNSVSNSVSLTVSSAALVSIAVTPSNASIPLGTLQQYTAIGTYTDNSTKDLTGTAHWSSSQTGVAGVATSGLLTGKGLGSSTISATSSSISGSTSVTVNTANVVSLRIQPVNDTIANGTTEQLAALATFNDGSTLNVTLTNGINWTSSTTAVATIGQFSGFATSKGAGSTVIGVSFGSFSDSTTLTVSNATIQSISVSPVNNLIAPGLIARFTATGAFSDGSAQNITNVVGWSSDNTSAATISNGPTNTGVATGVAQGVANITAKFASPGGPLLSGSTQLAVSNATLQSITVSPASGVISPAGIQQYTATGNFSDATTEVLTLLANWLSSQSSVATINSSGLATGVTSGSTNITATFGSVTSLPSALSVTASPLVSIAASCALPQIAINTSESCSAIGTFTDGSTQNLTPVVHWTSSRTDIATVSNTSGLRGDVSAISPGTTTLTAYLNGVVGTTNLVVSNAHLVSIDVAPANPTISLGGTQAFTALGHFDDGTTQNLTSEPAYLVQLEGDDRAFVWDVIFVDWTTASSNVAIINKAGIATSTGVGSATVGASLNGVSGSAHLNVQ